MNFWDEKYNQAYWTERHKNHENLEPVRHFFYYER